jgi:hypothetical protein
VLHPAIKGIELIILNVSNIHNARLVDMMFVMIRHNLTSHVDAGHRDACSSLNGVIK